VKRAGVAARDHGGPVVYEDHPTYPNLVGRVEHVAELGNLITDFTLIQPGALHRANGGYLIVDARRLLQQPLVWDELKRALRSKTIRIESLAQALSMSTAASLEPEPIPLDVKVVLLGERQLYYLLSALDPEFSELFKIAADFEEEIERTPRASDSTRGCSPPWPAASACARSTAARRRWPSSRPRAGRPTARSCRCTPRRSSTCCARPTTSPPRRVLRS